MKKFIVLISVSFLTVNLTVYSQQWNVVPSPNPDSERNLLRGVWANSPNDVWAVGEYGIPIKTLTEHWNGVNWTVINSPNPGTGSNSLEAVQGLSSNVVYAVGYYVFNSVTPQMLVLKWDGNSWTQQTTPTVTGGSSLQSIVIFGPDDIYAGGYKAVGAPGPTTGTLVTHWNGSSWNIEASPNQSNNRSNYITDMKGLSSNDIWAVGYSRNIAGTYQNMVLHKTGSDWNLVTVPQPGLENFLYQLAIIASDNIWVAGNYNDGTAYRAFFLHYNGSSWNVVTSPGGGGAGIAHNSSDDIWSSGSSFAHYDGVSWNSVSAPVPNEGSMLSMARVSSTDIWAVGRYIESNNLLSLTMHFEGPVVISDPKLFTKDYKLFQNYPNPFNPVTNLEFEISKSGLVSLKIYDLLGKEAATIVNSKLNPGTYKYKFDASYLPSGIYFYTLSSQDFKLTKRMMLLK